MKKKTEQRLMERLMFGIVHYNSHAEWEQKKAAQATNGSSIQREMELASAFNSGRAAACKEIMDYIMELEAEKKGEK